MERHIEWFENIQTNKERVYFPIPEMFNMDPIIKSYEKGGDTGHLYIVKVPNEKGFKIGSTTQLAIRMYYYPIGTELLFCKKMDGRLREKESEWIYDLKKDRNFKLYKGREWFTGDYEDAIKIFNNKIIKKEKTIIVKVYFPINKATNVKKVSKQDYPSLNPKEARARRMNIMRKKCIGHYRCSIRGPLDIASQ